MERFAESKLAWWQLSLPTGSTPPALGILSFCFGNGKNVLPLGLFN